MKDTMETPTTLTTLLRHVAAKFPSRRAISVAAKFDLTHSRLHRLVESAAAQLVSAGVKPGDVVALTFPNTIEVRSLSQQSQHLSIIIIKKTNNVGKL